jgi:hypothetical protein
MFQELMGFKNETNKAKRYLQVTQTNNCTNFTRELPLTNRAALCRADITSPQKYKQMDNKEKIAELLTKTGMDIVIRSLPSAEQMLQLKT